MDTEKCSSRVFIKVLWKFVKIISDSIPRQCDSQEFCIQQRQVFVLDNYGIVTYYKLLLINQVKATEYYSPSFDESLNKITPKE